MKELDLIDLLEQQSADFAFIATYEFDPAFFERRLLRTKALAQARRIVVFMDSGRYLELMRPDLPIRKLNRRYLVLPVPAARSGGVFHPKLLLLLGAERTTLLVGSSNWTRPGLTHNLELGNVLAIDEETFTSATEHPVPGEGAMRAAFRLFERFAEAVGSIGSRVPLKKEFFGSAAEDYPWLVSAFRPGDSFDAPELLHTLDGGLWQQVLERLQGQTVERVCVVSPFYDKDATLFDRVLDRWPRCVLDVTAQQHQSNVPTKALSAWVKGKKQHLALWEVATGSGRRLHAKAIAFRTSQATHWLVGSANFTTAALDGRNTETAFWFPTKQTQDTLLFGGGLPRQRIEPRDFIPGKVSPPEPAPSQPPQPLHLHSATLSEEGVLLASYSITPDFQPEILTIRVRFPDKADPCLSFPLSTGSLGEGRVPLSDNQSATIHGAAFCELIAQCREKEVLSLPVWLIQVDRLISDPANSGGASPGTKTTLTTGQEFLTRLEDLEKNGQWAEVIAFLKHGDIRFDDGSASGYRRAGRWGKPRNPFAGDDPDDRFDLRMLSDAAGLRAAIKDFVERHRSKLKKHINRGKLDGIQNFFDIMKTIHRLLFTYNRRGVLPDASYVIETVRDNILLFTGAPIPPVAGFLDTIRENLQGDLGLIRKRLEEERGPALLVAAFGYIQKLKARQKAPWTQPRPTTVPSWIQQSFATVGIKMPDAGALQQAEQEYGLTTSV